MSRSALRTRSTVLSGCRVGGSSVLMPRSSRTAWAARRPDLVINRSDPAAEQETGPVCHGGQLGRDGSHPLRGHADLASDEGSPDQAKEPGRGREVDFQKHSGQERAQETLEELAAQPDLAQSRFGGAVTAIFDPLSGSQSTFGAEHPEARLLGQRSDGGVEGRGGACGAAERVGEEMAAAVGVDHGPRSKGLQVEGAEVQYARRFGIGGVEDLEPSIEAPPVNHVGSYPTTGPVGGFDHHHAKSAARQVHSSR